MEINKHSVLIRKDEHLLSSKVFEDLVMLDTETGDYFGMNPVASTLWEQLQEAKSLAQVFPIIEQQFEVNEAQFYHDVLPFVEKLYKNGLLEVKEK